ncbi:hypothetical protein FOXB_15564, partial [Fusarium oxysporum f. sp. conglutinans Fo5176]
NSNNNYNKLK